MARRAPPNPIQAPVSSAPLSFGHHLPRYVNLAQALLRDVELGRYPIGGLLPGEKELAQQFGLSRHTVREAIRQLQEMGVVTRMQGVGTRVKGKPTPSRYVHRVDAIRDLFQYVKDMRLSIHSASEVVADEALAKRLECQVGQRWLWLVGLRHVEGEQHPVCATEVFVAYEFSSIRNQVGRSDIPIYALIESEFGERIEEVRQLITGVAISPKVAKSLRVKPGCPGLSITRHYRSVRDRTIEITFNIYPADRFSYSMSVSLESGSGRKP